MANEILTKLYAKTQIRFCVAGSFSPTSAGTNYTVSTPTDVAITLNGLTNGSGRQSAKVDLGSPRADRYSVMASVKMGTSPTADTRVDYYWAPSVSTTTATGNVYGNNGADAAAGTGATNVPSVAEFIRNCQYIGSLGINNVTNDVAAGFVGIFTPAERYGQLVVVNSTGVTFTADDVNNHCVFNALVDEIQ